MGLECQYVSSAIIFLVLPRFLMLSNDIAFILFDVHTSHHPGLRPTIHHLPVQIQRPSPVTDENASGYKGVERLARLAVYLRIVGIKIFGKVDVGPAHVEKAVGVSLRKLRGFIPGYDIVGDGGDLSRQPGIGA